MNTQIIIVLFLTFVIHLITTLAYSVRIVGTTTGKIVIAFSLFNILALVARTANSLQAPLLAKHLEQQMMTGAFAGLTSDFRWILLAATVATASGIFLMPTFQRSFIKVVEAFNLYRSVPYLLVHGFSKAGIHHLRTAVAIPSAENLADLKAIRHFPLHIVLLNIVVEAILTVGVLASLYAGSLKPELRVTANSLSAIITGLATIFLSVFIDPYLSILTDDVLQGKVSHLFFRRGVALLVGGRLTGTVLAQLLLIPAAYIIVAVAEFL
jgi:hypothetical protein